MTEKVNRTSLNPNDARMKQLRELFPEAFTEGKLDISKLRAAVGDEVEDRPERYSFTWAGKQDAIRIIQTPSRATLVPVREESVNFDTTQNVFIEGDNLEVLKLLIRSYYGRVKMIYIDPPYNTGNDFVYPDDYADPLNAYLKMTGQVNGNGDHTTSNTDRNGRYHSAWLSMMYPRLFLARQLLRQDGIIFVSIDDHEIHNLRNLMTEIFGDECFIAEFVWKSRQNVDSRSINGVSNDHEYILAFGRSTEARVRGQEINKRKYANPDSDPRGPWMSSPLDGIATKEQRPNLHYVFADPATGISYSPSPENGWRFQRSTMEAMITEKRVLFSKNPNSKPRIKRYLEDLNSDYTGFSSVIPDDIFTSEGTRELRDLMGLETVKFPKPVTLIKLLAEQATEAGDIVLDFFGGSGTTAQATWELGRENGGARHFIMVQLPEKLDDKAVREKGYQTIADVAKERLRRVSHTMRNHDAGTLFPSPASNEDLGFRVYKLAKSNYWQWKTPDDQESLMKQLEFYVETELDAEWKPEPLMYEIALKEGFSLNLHVQQVEGVIGCTVYEITSPNVDKRLFVTLDEKVPTDLTSQLKLTLDDVLVCHDKALDDETSANFVLRTQVKSL